MRPRFLCPRIPTEKWVWQETVRGHDGGLLSSRIRESLDLHLVSCVTREKE